MKNLKNISLYKIITILFIITLGITYYRITNYKTKKQNINEITGIIKNIKYNNEKLEIELENTNILIIKYIDKKPNIELGDKIKATGLTAPPNKNTIPNLFNYQKYLQSKKLNLIMNADEIIKIENNKQVKYKIKNAIIKHIEKYKTKEYLNTFIIGNNNIEENTKKLIQNNGVSHLFAVSGMHLSIFSSIIFFALTKTKTKENIIYIIVILFFIFFAFLTNYSPSVLRSLLMYIGLSINKLFNIKIKSIYICLISLFILLIINPFYIFNIGFIFSYTISLTLIIYSKKIKFKCYFKSLLYTSTISFLVSIPILIQNYFQINALTPLINVIFIPLITFIIFPMSLVTFFIKPFDNLLSLLIEILEYLLIVTEKINLNIILSKLPWYVIIIYYILIIIFIDGLIYKNYKKTLPLIIIILVHSNIKYINKNYTINFLDVNQGDSILITLPKNNNIMIDTGGNYNSKIINNKTVPYLKSEGIKKINYLIITHGDYDHIGEAINLINNFKVEKVIFNCGEFNELEQDLINVLEKKKIPYYSCIKELNIDDNKLYFLNNKEYGNENDNSSVIYTKLNNHKFLFMGDAGLEVEKDLIEKYNLKDIDVLKVGHHGSKTSSSKNFINEIEPKYSIISVGKNNRYGHPNKEVLNTLDESKIYRTDQDGSIMFKIKNNKLEVETCSP